MSRWYIGIDTSNYRTSLSAWSPEKGMLWERKLLPVPSGSIGLRQSDAVFAHVRQLPELTDKLFPQLDGSPVCVTVSDRPRDAEGSYMPCFLAGECVARALASSYGIPLRRVSHQTGHILAGLYSADAMHLVRERFLAFHVSGGTTEALLVEPDPERVLHCTCVADSLDLKAGQVIDRAGVMLGLPFPAGEGLSVLAEKCTRTFKIRPFLRDGCCSLSGIENQTKKMQSEGASPEEIARFTLDSVCAALDGMTAALLEKYGGLPVLFAGGVMANREFRARLGKKYSALFASPELSGDNACGVALAGALLDGAFV